MTISRLAQIQFAKLEFDQRREYDPERIAEPLAALVELIVDVSKNPAMADSPQRKPEAFLAESIARELFEKNAYLLNYTGCFEKVYSLIEDPSVLSASIARALSESPKREDFYVKHQEILEKSLNLGGLVLPQHAPANQNLINPAEVRSRYVFTDLSQAKRLLENQVKNHWAAEFHQHQRYDLGGYLIFLVGYVGDQDPVWAVNYTLKNSDFLEPAMAGYPISVDDPLSRVFAAVLHGTTTTDMLVAIKTIRPDIYDTLMDSQWMPLLLQKLVVLPEFKLSPLAPHPILAKDFHTKMFVRIGSHNSLTEARFRDIESSWMLSGFSETPAGLISAVRSSEGMKDFSESITTYKDLLRSPSLTAQDLVEKTGKFSFAGDNFPLFDALVSRAKDRLSGSETMMANHSAYGLTAHWLSDKSKQIGPIKAITLGVAILGLKKNKHNERLSDFVAKTFNDKAYHGEVAKLTGELVDMAFELAPGIDQKVMRKVNWEDRSIKARMLETDLGM